MTNNFLKFSAIVSVCVLLGVGCTSSGQNLEVQAIQQKQIDYFEKKKECSVFYSKQLKIDEDQWGADGKTLGNAKVCYSKKYNTCAFIYEVNTTGTKFIILVDDVLTGGAINWNAGDAERPGENAFASDLIQAELKMDNATKSVDCAE